MKTKALNGFLIFLIVIIYAYLARSFFSNEGETDHSVDETPFTLDSVENHLSYLAKHTIDPFRSTYIPKKTAPKKKKKVIQVNRPIVKLPKFTISGKVYVKNKWQLTVNYTNNFFYIHEKDTMKDIYFDKISADSVKITYKEKQFTIANEVN